MGRNRETLVRSSCVILFMYPIAYITPSYREGKKLRQLREALTKIGVTVIPVELPYYSGPETCLHLLSLISIVDHQLVVIYPPLLSVPFWQEHPVAASCWKAIRSPNGA